MDQASGWISVTVPGLTRLDDKNEELIHVALTIGLLRLGVRSLVLGERPDFVLELDDGRKIALEHTRARDEFIAAGLGARKRLKGEILKGLVDGEIGAEVYFRLPEGAGAVLEKAGSGALRQEAAAITAAARELVNGEPSPSGWRLEVEWSEPSEREPGIGDLAGRGISYATGLWIRAADKPRVGWSASGSGQSAHLIQDAINRKAGLLETYKQHAGGEHWLLVVGSTGTGGALDISDGEDHEFESPFDKTVFLEWFEQKCMYLSTRARS